MTDLLAARSQMAMSLAFHIIFSVIGIGLPLLMVIAEWRWMRTGDATYLDLAKRWSKGAAILFAVGAVSGTVLSFELGLLWPNFMRFAGPIIGMPFSLEGFAFFTEAIFLGVYLYGWERIGRGAHLFSGVVVALSGVLSGIFVVMANAWMNAPTGFELIDGKAVDVRPFAAMANSAAFSQTLHMTLAAYAATGLGVAGIHATLILRRNTAAFHRYALAIALAVGAPAAILQPLSGDISARHVAREQPVKLAALEAHFETRRGAPLNIGGWPDVERRETRWAIRIPRGLSFLAFHHPDAEVQGLSDFPRDEWPPVAIVHVAFQTMVALGSVLALVSVAALWRWWRARGIAGVTSSPLLLRALAVATPMGFIAIEAGWTVTEVGRQPWIVYGVLRTADAVTPMPGLVIPFLVFSLLYVLLGVIVVYMLRQHIVRSPARDGAR
ncbi:MAG TPA: cytochrome ubiquinol oxidase subunit I [Gemmatimonadaceae bacterium]|nr:cytochrome ubiquinol oxidase subunit I [Gemmatimonadaceae bacterium]